jgi:hypothetical protein
LCWTREGVPPQPDRTQGCLIKLNACSGLELDNALVGMSMHSVVFKSRLATGRVMEVECGVVVLDAGGRTSGTRERAGMFQ